MSCVRWFTSAAICAISLIASSVHWIVTPSVASSAAYCARQRVRRLGEDAHEVVGGERLELDADREPALHLGDEVARLGHVERAGGDEQDVIGLHRAVLRRDGRALDDRQQVALHALARDIDAVAIGARRDLVDLVDEHDAGVLGAPDGLARQRVLVIDELVRLLRGQRLPRLRDLELLALRLAAERCRACP